MTQAQQLIALFKNAVAKTMDTPDFLIQLNEIFPKSSFGYYGGYSSNFTNEEYKELETLYKALFKIIDIIGGSEGDGEYYAEIIYVIPYDIYIKRVASYYSYDGLDYFQDFYIVEKKQRMVEYYE